MQQFQKASLAASVFVGSVYRLMADIVYISSHTPKRRCWYTYDCQSKPGMEWYIRVVGGGITAAGTLFLLLAILAQPHQRVARIAMFTMLCGSVFAFLAETVMALSEWSAGSVAGGGDMVQAITIPTAHLLHVISLAVAVAPRRPETLDPSSVVAEPSQHTLRDAVVCLSASLAVCAAGEVLAAVQAAAGIQLPLAPCSGAGCLITVLGGAGTVIVTILLIVAIQRRSFRTTTLTLCKAGLCLSVVFRTLCQGWAVDPLELLELGRSLSFILFAVALASCGLQIPPQQVGLGTITLRDSTSLLMLERQDQGVFHEHLAWGAFHALLLGLLLQSLVGVEVSLRADMQSDRDSAMALGTCRLIGETMLGLVATSAGWYWLGQENATRSHATFGLVIALTVAGLFRFFSEVVKMDWSWEAYDALTLSHGDSHRVLAQLTIFHADFMDMLSLVAAAFFVYEVLPTAQSWPSQRRYFQLQRVALGGYVMLHPLLPTFIPGALAFTKTHDPFFAGQDVKVPVIASVKAAFLTLVVTGGGFVILNVLLEQGNRPRELLVRLLLGVGCIGELVTEGCWEFTTRPLDLAEGEERAGGPYNIGSHAQHSARVGLVLTQAIAGMVLVSLCSESDAIPSSQSQLTLSEDCYTPPSEFEMGMEL